MRVRISYIFDKHMLHSFESNVFTIVNDTCIYTNWKEFNTIVEGIKSKLDEKRVLAWITQTSCG